jgi:hypothetical protein
MMIKFAQATLAAASFVVMAGVAQAQAPAPAPAAPAAPVSGMIASGAPQDIFLEVTTATDGAPILSQEEFPLVLGGYYRFNFVCPDAQDDSTGFHLEVNDLLSNSHLRVVSVQDIEIYMQGMTFRAIECDEIGAARFSFHPMRRGIYDIYVRDHSDPAKEAFGRFIVE